MNLTIRFLLIYPLLLLLILFALSFSLQLFNPFGSACIKGDCKNGYGTYLYSSGMQYKGEWKNGKRDGQGILTYSDGSRYTGEWRNNRMHGKGIKIYSSDRLYKKYDGYWKNGNKHGIGTALYSDDSKYVGHWRNGDKNGQGIITTSYGYTIEGKWDDEVLQGEMTETYPDGKIIIVGRKNNFRHGRGVLIYPDGTKITGEWFNNRLIGSPDFYLFHYFEFTEHYDITNLCSALKADTALSLSSPGNSIEWLNELLKEPNLYEKFNKKLHKIDLSPEIDALAERTGKLRNKRFSELNKDDQIGIIKLNRLLLERLYPDRTPKS